MKAILWAASAMVLAACVPSPTLISGATAGGAGGVGATSSSGSAGGAGGVGATSSSGSAGCTGAACDGVLVAVGLEFSCAIVSGGVRCWGGNDDGELGDGTTITSHVPVSAMGLSSDVVALTANLAHACAVTAAGAAYCWGKNSHGELGIAAGTQSLVPVAVPGLSTGVAEITAGAYHTCARTVAGAVKCWGSNSAAGQLGNDSTTDSFTPVDVKGLSTGVLAIAAGGDSTCAVTAGGAVTCWGDNTFGGLGDGTTIASRVPVDVKGLSLDVVALAASSGHTCARTSQGAVYCWGHNSAGELGDDTKSDAHAPVAVKGLSSGIVGITAGGEHTCAVTAAGALLCWGQNSSGELGLGSKASSFVPAGVKGLSAGVLAASAGSWRTCAVMGTGGVKCWGDNAKGGLGNDSTTESSIPVDVLGL